MGNHFIKVHNDTPEDVLVRIPRTTALQEDGFFRIAPGSSENFARDADTEHEFQLSTSSGVKAYVLHHGGDVYISEIMKKGRQVKCSGAADVGLPKFLPTAHNG